MFADQLEQRLKLRLTNPQAAMRLRANHPPVQEEVIMDRPELSQTRTAGCWSETEFISNRHDPKFTLGHENGYFRGIEQNIWLVLAKPRLYAIELDCGQCIKKPSFLTKDFPHALPKERLSTTDSDWHRAVHSHLFKRGSLLLLSSR
jgi:hypothetical protein